MRADLISVVIPTYNYGRFVTEAVDSVLAQSYAPREVIVVDDGSTDDTPDRLAPYRARIRYIRQDNQGLSAARNTGIRLAQGTFVALLDSDDLWHPRKLEFQMRYLTRHPEVMLLGSNCQTGVRDWPALNDAEIVGERITLEELIVRSPFAPSTAVLHRDCLAATSLFDTSLRSVEDRDMWIRVAARFPVAMLQAPLCWYRLHDGSMSRVATRMEDYEQRVLHKSFDTIEALRGRWLLKRKAFSYALTSSAWMYREAGEHGTALGRLMQSLALWPLPYRRGEVRMPLVRTKLLGTTVLRALQGARNRFCCGAVPRKEDACS
ncbi:MAG: glycosyltransferase family 2 protein [Gemmataceae bacterium]|nr:glycosyltransferase family 2 protein [Gemmataceae bacterium]